MTEPAEALDPVEQEYMVAMRRCRDDMEAYELSIGLAEYRRMFKSGFVPARSRSERGREASC